MSCVECSSGPQVKHLKKLVRYSPKFMLVGVVSFMGHRAKKTVRNVLALGAFSPSLLEQDTDVQGAL